MLKWNYIEAVPEDFQKERNYWLKKDGYDDLNLYFDDLVTQLTMFSNFKPILYAFNLETMPTARYTDFLQIFYQIRDDLWSGKLEEPVEQPLSVLKTYFGDLQCLLSKNPTEKDIRIFFQWAHYWFGSLYYHRYYSGEVFKLKEALQS